MFFNKSIFHGTKLHPVGGAKMAWEGEITLNHNFLQVTLRQGVVPVSLPAMVEIVVWLNWLKWQFG